MSLEQIKNDYAVSKGYDNFCNIIFDFDVMDIDEVSEYIDEVMKIYAMECLKLASENVKMKMKSNIHELSMNDDWSEIDKNSITNENNIIK